MKLMYISIYTYRENSAPAIELDLISGKNIPNPDGSPAEHSIPV
jgi:hypothetical protein